MKHRNRLALCALLATTSAFAGGYQVALQGQRQIGMGHTGTALAYDASSIFFNPGGLVFTKRNNITVGGSIIRSRVAYLAPQDANAPSDYTAQTESPLGTPFTFYASYGKAESNLKFGLGVYTPYGSGVKWADDWKGYAVLQELSLQSIFIQPTVSYRIGDIGFGAGFVYALGAVDLRRGIGAIASSEGFSSAQLKGNASGMGYNVGVHYAYEDDFTLGISYRSKVDMKVAGGDATFNVPSSAVLIGLFPSGGTKFDATLPLPATLSFGMADKLSKRFTMAFDFNVVFWSAYKELKFDYEKPVNRALSTTSPRKYRDSYIMRIGGEYMASPKLAIRAGYYYDQTPVPDGYMTPETPDANRNGFTCGFGYKFSENFSADASFLFIEGEEREQKQSDINKTAQDGFLAGTYKLRIMVPGVSLSYKF
jgi:long-chain fatty acid transport protein